MAIRRKKKQKINGDKVLLVKDTNADFKQAELLDVVEVLGNEIYTTGEESPVFPLADATVLAMRDGTTVYSYNVSLKYLEQLTSLSLIEKNVAIKNMFAIGEQKSIAEGNNWVIIALLVILVVAIW